MMSQPGRGHAKVPESLVIASSLQGCSLGEPGEGDEQGGATHFPTKAARSSVAPVQACRATADSGSPKDDPLDREASLAVARG